MLSRSIRIAILTLTIIIGISVCVLYLQSKSVGPFSTSFSDQLLVLVGIAALWLPMVLSVVGIGVAVLEINRPNLFKQYKFQIQGLALCVGTLIIWALLYFLWWDNLLKIEHPKFKCATYPMECPSGQREFWTQTCEHYCDRVKRSSRDCNHPMVYDCN